MDVQTEVTTEELDHRSVTGKRESLDMEPEKGGVLCVHTPLSWKGVRKGVWARTVATRQHCHPGLWGSMLAY